MKIKRFFAADIRQAMRMVKEELGADAVIMSNRSVDGGVEIVAARDFDEQMVHKNLAQQSEVKARPAPEISKPVLPGFDGEKKPVHLVSSPRKRGAEHTNGSNPIRRNLDQYIGYAEKLQVASAQSQKIAEKIKLPEQPANAAVASRMKAQLAEAAKQPVSPHTFVDELRQEMKELRAVLDSRLAGLATQAQWRQNAGTQDELLTHLADQGFSRKLLTTLSNQVGSLKQPELALNKAREMLARITPIADDDLLQRGGIAALVGSTGVGKTTTIAKLAAQFILKNGSRDVALITTDNYRIGAHEQINTYGRILDVPVRVANDAEELRQHISSFGDRRLILIDTAGMSQRDMRIAEHIHTLQTGDLPIRAYLVMSAATQYRAALEIMDAFQGLQPQSTILTKLDEAVSRGSALSALIERKMPLSFVTDGQQVPEDIYAPEAEALMQVCLADWGTMEAENETGADGWLAEMYA